jgi:hypothetical protein
MKPEKSERLSASQIEELSKILGVEATEIKAAFKFYFPGATWTLEEALSNQDKLGALLMYGAFKVGYLGAMSVKAKGSRWIKSMELLGEPTSGRHPP